MSPKKSTDTVRLVLDLPDTLFIDLKQSAKVDLRTNAKQAQYLIEVGLAALSQQGTYQEEVTDAPVTEAIGFKMEAPEEAPEEEQDIKPSRKKKK